MNEIEKSMSNKKLNKVIQKCYQLSGKPNIIQIEISQRGPENRGACAVETIAIRSSKANNNIINNNKNKTLQKSSTPNQLPMQQ